MKTEAKGELLGDDAKNFVILPTKLGTAQLTVFDNRTGETHQIPIEDGSVKATDFKKIKGLTVYDPAYMNTAVCKSKICEIDGDKGILRYR